MSRLTEKREKPLTTKWEDVPTSYYKIKGDDTGVAVSEIERLNKLGKLEDLEEQLGCPLEVITQALKEGIYYKFREDNSNKLNKMKVPMLRIIEGEYCWICPKWTGAIWMNVKLKDYKNTWWLKEDKSE